MSKHQILRSLTNIEARSQHIVGGASGTAIDGILADCAAIRVLLESDLTPAVSMTDPSPQSSVQIEQAAKGPPRVTVKVYSADPVEAAQRATGLFDGLVEGYDRSEGLHTAAVDMLNALQDLASGGHDITCEVYIGGEHCSCELAAAVELVKRFGTPKAEGATTP